jgi:hypothetical protein
MRRVALAAAVLAGVGFGAAQVTHIDAYSNIRTYGVSVGTDTHYCSADFVGWSPRLSCEAAS